MLGNVRSFPHAFIPWYFTGAFLLGAIVTLVLLLAIRHAEAGYEDDSGFHFEPTASGQDKFSRPAKPLRGGDSYSCDHSRERENRSSRHGPHPR